MSTGLPLLGRGERMDLFWDKGSAYELENGDVFLVALVHGFDEYEYGAEKARADATNRVFALLPPGYGEPKPYSDWCDLIVHGIFGYARKFIAKKKESPDGNEQP